MPDTTTVLVMDHEEAERFRRGHGGKYDREVGRLAQSFAHHRAASEARLLARMVEPDMVEVVADVLYESFGGDIAAVNFPLPATNALTAIAAKLQEQG